MTEMDSAISDSYSLKETFKEEVHKEEDKNIAALAAKGITFTKKE